MSDRRTEPEVLRVFPQPLVWMPERAMPERSSTVTPDAPRIAINGRYLDEVRTPIEYGHERWAGYARLPAEHHRAIIADDTVTLRIPPLTALQLYVDGTLPIDRSVPVSLEVGGQALGEFLVEWLRCADRHYAGEPMFLRLRASKSAGPSRVGTTAHEDEPDGDV